MVDIKQRIGESKQRMGQASYQMREAEQRTGVTNYCKQWMGEPVQPQT